MKGMSPIVQNMARLVTGFVLIFGLYIACSGQAAPGGGFAGAVIVLAGVVLGILAFGGQATKELVAEDRCQTIAAVGAVVFLLVSPAGLWLGLNLAHRYLPEGDRWRAMIDSATPLVTDLSMALLVGAGLAGLFLALVIATRRAMPKE